RLLREVATHGLAHHAQTDEAEGGRVRHHGFQKPCDGMRNARLKRDDAFSHAMIIVSSAIVSSSKCCCSRANSASSTSRLVSVIASAYSSAAFSASLNSGLVAWLGIASIFSVGTPSLLLTAAWTSCQNSHPFHAATRRLSSALRIAGTRPISCCMVANIRCAARKYAGLRA